MVHVWLSCVSRVSMCCAHVKTPGLCQAAWNEAVLQQASTVLLAGPRGAERAECLNLLGSAEEAKSRTPWHCCEWCCCLPGQVQEAFFLCWVRLSCHPVQRTIKNYQGICSQ